MRMREPQVCVVLLNWNGRDDTLACLDSLMSTDYADLEIMVIDQGSCDGLVEVLRRCYPQVRLIVNERNAGYAAGCNQGIQHALENGADYIMLLNNDTILDAGCIRELVRTAEANPGAGALGPKIRYYNEPDRIWAVGGMIDFTENVSRCRGYHQVDRGQFNQVQEVDYVPGCAVLAPAPVIQAVGALNERFFPAYYEDADWGRRIRAAGYINLAVPSATVWHKVSAATGGDYSPTSKYLLGYHAVTFMRSYATPSRWLKFIAYAVLSLPFVWIKESWAGRGASVVAKARGLRDGFLRRPLSANYFPTAIKR